MILCTHLFSIYYLQILLRLKGTLTTFGFNLNHLLPYFKVMLILEAGVGLVH